MIINFNYDIFMNSLKICLLVLKAEINKVLDIGVDADRIIFANPAKPASHIRHAKDVSVDTMTFDNECEIHKIKSLFPDAR